MFNKKQFIFLMIMLFTVPCHAAKIALTVVHEYPLFPVTKYVVKYSQNPTDDLSDTAVGMSKTITPTNPQAVENNLLIDLGHGATGTYYFSVRELYSDGFWSNYSDMSLPINVPVKPSNVRIVE